MFKQIFLFELKLWFKRPSVYIFFLIFFALSILVTAGRAGLLGTSSSDSNIIINSASAIARLLNSLNTNLIGVIILVTIIAPAVYKDFEFNMHPLLFTKPISKFGYMFGRFSAVFFVALFVLSGSVFGHMLACTFPGIEAEKLGPFKLMNYLQPFILFIIPNTLLVGAIFFSLVTFTRNMIAGYIGCIVLLLIKNIIPALLSDIDNQTVAAVIEPFGTQAFSKITKYWTPVEQNTLGIPFEGVMLYNRLLWIGIGLFITIATYWKFQFSQFNSPVSFFSRNKKETFSIASAPVNSLADVPTATQTFSSKFNLYQTWFLAKFEFNKIVKSIFFIIIVLISIALFIIISPFLSLIYGTATYPVTYQILEIGLSLFSLFMSILIVFYGGIVVWRERDAKVDELIGAAPIAPWISFVSKLTALILVQAVLLLVIMFTGIGIQIYKGYYHFEILLYLKELFGFNLISMAISCVLCMAVQVISNNKYVGYFISALIIAVLPIAFALLEWNNGLYQFNSNGPVLQYSDMNGYGHSLFPFLIFKSYWIGFALILIAVSNLLWVRGKEKGFKNRLRIAKPLFTGNIRLTLVSGVLIFTIAGGYIFYNTNILNKNSSSKKQEKESANFEKKYKHFEKTPQPRIIAANWDAAIFPLKRGVKMKGYYILKNKHNKPLDSIIVNLNTEINLKALTFNKLSTKVLNDTTNGFMIYKLEKPLQPGDSIKMTMDIDYFPKGFKTTASTTIVYNGTFFNSMILPSIGYNPNSELSDNSTRKKNGLGKKERMANVNDSLARMNNYISNDADWIDFECIVSTSKDQIALAPGYLQKEWEKDGRKYYQYKMDCKILNFYSFLSARYEVKRDKWIDIGSGKTVSIEIYYNKGHEYNLDRMINGIKKSLDYYTKNFSPYQHKQVRIIEFPRYATFAQSFPNTIPFSEGIGFIAKVDDKDAESIDYPFYVISHEVAHQWWAHQVIGGNVQGSTLMSETMSQYSAMMVMEKEFGKQAMKKFLKYEMNKYLLGRTQEDKKELPLMLVEDQQYIHYNKGSVIMYALKDYIGEDSLNATLANYIKQTAYQEPPYTNSIEFINLLKQVTPDSLKYIIHDMFETITLYENKTTKCTYTKTKDGKYLVKISVESKKMQADSVGRMKDVTFNDWIDIGIFGSKEVNGKKTETELYLQKRKINKNKMDFEIIVNEEPVKVGIDPYNKLIDRSPDNNTKTFKGGDKESDSNDQGGNVTIKIGN